MDQTRAALLSEATQSPNLLGDLAGLERYVAESYTARTFVELLQNADDAGATRFHIRHDHGLLFAANDGAHFTASDFESLCRSSASRKRRGDGIGYRGIGFKSVVGIATRAHVVSQGLSATFCREMTRKTLASSSDVPLVRIPHPLVMEERAMSVVAELKDRGMNTVFVFEGLVSHALEAEFEGFDSSVLLFLNSVQHIEFSGGNTLLADCTVSHQDETEKKVRITTRDGFEDWRITTATGVAIAVREEGGRPVPIQPKEAVAYAFLPTQESTGFGIKVNGDFSTDPSRTKIVMDEQSLRTIEQLADLLLSCIEKAIASGEPSELSVFMPADEIRLAEFGRPSLFRSLALALRERGTDRFVQTKLRPLWFRTYRDFHALAARANLVTLVSELEEVSGVSAFLKALGATYASLEDLEDTIPTYKFSGSAAVDVLANICELHSTGQWDDKDVEEWCIWPTSDSTVSTASIRATPVALACLPLLHERIGSTSPVRRLAASLVGAQQALVLVPDKKQTDSQPQNPTKLPPSAAFIAKRIGNAPTQVSKSNSKLPVRSAEPKVTKWRAAESQVAEYLTSQGWKVTDVSRRNVGYDLEAISPEGEEYFIEVKLVARVRADFSLTSNEEVVARDKRHHYLIAVVHMAAEFFEIEFLSDPVHSLELVRQCQRWAWHCEAYRWEPDRVPFAAGA